MDLFGNLVVTALLGGALIGTALGILTLFTGRVMSGSRMIGSLLGGAEGIAATSIAFIGGLVAVSLTLNGMGLVPWDVGETSLPLLILGGVLVGMGARLGGASLGEVLTGIARRAPRAIVLLLLILGGATIGGTLQAVLGALGAGGGA